jgi:formate transporter
MAERVKRAGIDKANLNIWTMFALALLAGLFIGLGAEFCTLVITGINVGFGLTKLLGGIAFCLGLILVVVAGAELFTGNNLLTIAWLSGAVPFKRVLMNWGIVFTGNLVGSLALVGLMFATRQWMAADYAVGATALRIAADKAGLPFMTSLARGVLCNVLVCLAVWQCFSARGVADKILAIVFPIAAFVASGFEHSVANMYFIPYGLALRGNPQVVATAALSTDQLNHLTLAGFLNNLIPVTIGNLIGGGIMVGMMYWFIFLRHERRAGTFVEAMPTIEPVSRPLALLPEGSVMKSEQTPAVLLYSFTIASADMFYSEINQREIYVRDDPETGFHIWGELPGGGGVADADLGEILLEYAMTCAAQGSLPQAYRQMDTFGKSLGERLAIRIIQSTPAEATVNRAACALECVLESLGVQFVVEQDGGELSYTLDSCPLCDKAARTGLSQVELAHHGLNALCHSLVEALDPDLIMRLPREPDRDQIFTVVLNESHTVPT